MKKPLVIISSLLVLSIVLSFTFTKAKYLSNSVWDYYLNSKGFYFESDNLGNNKININNFWDGSDISFNIKNNNGTSYDVDTLDYNVKCIVPSGVTCILSKTNSSLNGGTKVEETLYFNVISNDDVKDIDVKIIASSVKPYKKTITGTFKLHKATNELGSIEYDLKHYDNYSILSISNYYNYDKRVNVRWDNNSVRVLSKDIFVVSTDNQGYINNFNIEISHNTTKEIKFYNTLDNNYTKEIFNIDEVLSIDN